MRTVILCGGRGTRLGEHGRSVPKALITIGDRPILWHLLKSYSHYGFSDFVLCLGYLGDEIRRFVGEIEEDWTIECVDTGVDTNTGGRLKRVEKLLANEGAFFVTYGDGLSDIDLGGLLAFHQQHGRAATVTAVHPRSNFGLMELASDGRVKAFQEKPILKEWINGGFFVFDHRVFDALGVNDVLEKEPLEKLAAAGDMMAFRHEGFWKCMDTFKDGLEFDDLWKQGGPWRVW